MTAGALCTFRVGANRYGVPVERVVEVVTAADVTPVPLAPASVLGLLNLRGEILMAVSLRRVFGLDDAEGDGERTHLVVRHGEEALTLVVDAAEDVFDAGEAPLEPCPASVPQHLRGRVRGVALLERELLLALDLDRLLAEALP